MSRTQNPVVGALLGLGAFGLYAAYDISIKFLGGGYSAIQILFFSGLMALPLTLAYAMADPAQGTLRPARPGLMAVRVVIVVVNGIIGAYKRARAIIVAPMQYSQILWATILGLLLFGERPSAATALGMVMIILSGLVIVARRDPAP